MSWVAIAIKGEHGLPNRCHWILVFNGPFANKRSDDFRDTDQKLKRELIAL